jgi:hypothetical protein
VVFVADNPDYVDYGNFPAYADTLANQYLPSAYSAQKIYYGITHTTVSAARTAIKDSFNQGALIVNYIGHGYMQSWAGENLLSVSAVPSLNANARLPFVVSMSCMVGYFHFPSFPNQDNSSLAEVLLRSSGKGAVAVWASTGMGYADGQDFLNRGLFTAIFINHQTRLGVAISQAKLYLSSNTYGYTDLIDTFTLFGDPATQLNIALNTISGTLWRDTDANGVLGGGEAGRFQSINMVLYDSSSNIVATTVTDASGNYSFGNLPDGAYTVHVSDDANSLDGYWHSLGAAGSDNNSQADPYSVTVGPGNRTNTTADFGYYNPATMGHFVWLDRNNNGAQDANEPGIRGVQVTLTINYPSITNTTLVTVSGSGGIYSFGNLLLDENLDGAGGSEPIYTIGVNTPPGVTPSPENAPGNNSYDSGFYTQRLDLGDLPQGIDGSPNYPTIFNPGPAHIVFPDGPDPDTNPDTTNGVPAVWLGMTVDTELEGQPSANALGDGADEDGLAFASSGWIPGQTSVVSITLNSSASGVTVYYGLWIDWNANGNFFDTDDGFYSGSGVTHSPVVVPVVVSVPGSYTANNVYFRVRTYDAPLTRADYQGTLVNGEVEDYLRKFGPTAVIIASFIATPQQGSGLLVSWETALETSLVGFNVYRSTSPDGEYTQVNPELIPAQAMGSVFGSTYTWLDSDTQPNIVYYYKLEVVDTSGDSTFFGPVTASLSPSLYRIYLPEVSRAEP